MSGVPSWHDDLATLLAFLDTHEFVGDTDIDAARAAHKNVEDEIARLTQERDDAVGAAEEMQRQCEAAVADADNAEHRAEAAERALAETREAHPKTKGMTKEEREKWYGGVGYPDP